MRIAIIGYGKMGKEIELCANKLSIPVSKIIKNKENLQAANFAADEVAIEFTNPQAFLTNIRILCSKKVTTVAGTTGWYEHKPEIKQIIADNHVGFLYSANFSIGVNLFWSIIKHAAKLMDNQSQYDTAIHEIHHKKKQDSPSGTALQTAKILLSQLKQKSADELHIGSTRSGYTIGEHSVMFDSPFDNITITHTAKNREGFALGAIECAKWLQQNKKIGFFNMDDYWGDMLK